MAEIEPVNEQEITEVIKDNESASGNLERTKGKDLRELLIKINNRFEQELTKVRGASLYGPYQNSTVALSLIALEERFKGLTIGIITQDGVEEYWWKSGVEDNNLIVKNKSGEDDFSLSYVTADSDGNLTL